MGLNTNNQLLTTMITLLIGLLAMALVGCTSDSGNPDDDDATSDDDDATSDDDDATDDDDNEDDDTGDDDDSNPMADGIVCGEDTCDVGAVCCVDAGLEVEIASYYCAEDADECPSTGFQMHCDGPEDCDAGHVCCIYNPGLPVGAYCQTEAACGEYRRLCNDEDDCVALLSCQPGEYLGWEYTICT